MTLADEVPIASPPPLSLRTLSRTHLRSQQQDSIASSTQPGYTLKLPHPQCHPGFLDPRDLEGSL